MVIEITRREVLNNLIRFKDTLLERRRDRNPEKNKKRIYRVLLNRHTGDMRFAQKISELEHRVFRKEKRKEGAADWKETHLIVEQSARETHFELLDAKDHPIKPSELDPLAWKIAKETVQVLNLKSQESKAPPETLPEEAALQDLSSIHLTTLKGGIEELSGWAGTLNRFEAEEKLQKQAPGTYLIREADPLTISSIAWLQEENLLSIQPYLLSILEKNGKISEILILQTEKGWTYYQDEPNLHSRRYHFFHSPRDLLHMLIAKL